jgi:hypothetical protein
MEVGIAVLTASVLSYSGFLLRSELRAMRVEWRVRRGLRTALAQEA